ncbi:hypothetical protein PV325_011990 [Microctonus aethiopoides]|uniref:Pyrroline-5-carboxylate reductase n=1 Tax=Microctonus aethiopoides TaxID=144406 RepID=A0AA39KK46_9HYME|nr:hypothetical protein PV326_014467 [Microctonus aethiopoides]KAK0088461.1 hypothetical protein PV325_011990 [Microctonus aethiopoides]KAK0164468.1 hypothetical protein PV328_003092 [Microctonus aethiopoides]
MRIGFLGAGKMAQALAKGFIKAGTSRGEMMMASCLPSDKHSIQAFEAFGSKVVFTNEAVAEYGNILIISVKPQVVPIVLEKLQNVNQLVLSLAMGISLSYLETKLPKGTPVIRVMPNTPASIGFAASVFVRGNHADDKHVETVKNMFSTIGICQQIDDESLMDTVTALAGSGPAYVYMMIEALADGAVNMGMPRQLAYQLASQTVVGAGMMVKESGHHPAQLKDDVASPAGSTIAGIHHLETHGMRSAIIGAIQAATLRCAKSSETKKF